ncbi:selenocysteine-specific translation elongation factor [Brachybacterium avium]|uniref:Selenocysteine-specific translation elongation factor n=1 Tax=Brachybacterium avium TaxID=2017485 RepID=A0A220UEL2_9MICO|nr:selenocysteine-specific translation elongation factor [Brachybacterium avium]ASK66545.1 selenocysteine-specific translation elongation factor [Brachybacterium avium]
MRQVIATAGHVDHGKSTLIRALTGSDPDRWAEEKRRGLTLDLGFAWTTLASGDEVSFVDVPGHERFLGNMLAGLGPAPIVCFVVAADEGWQAQSCDHRDAIAALGIDRGLLVVTRADLAPDRVGEVLAQARTELAGTGLAAAPAVAVSALTGAGIEELRRVLGTVVAAAHEPAPEERVRLWVDRSFSISGAGTIVTGTLSGGTLRVGQTLERTGEGPARRVQVRGLQSREETVEQLGPVSRAAVNLRGVDADSVSRGDALLSLGAWTMTALLDVRATARGAFAEAPAQLVVHAGTAAVPARVRPLGPDHARLALDRSLPLRVGDRMVLRGSGDRVVRTGALVLDVDPPALTRRGDAARRSAALAASSETGDLAAEVARRGAVPAAQLSRYGVPVPEMLPAGVLRSGTLLVAEAAHTAWSAQLRQVVTAEHEQHPLSAGLARKAALDVLGTHPELLPELIDRAGLIEQDGRILDPRRSTGLGAAETATASLEQRLRGDPFAAPEADGLTALGLGPEQLAAAARQGRLLRLPGEVILLPTAPALAMRELARLEQPFTTSQARQALGTSRRVAIPLLEHLDARGWTRRIDAGHRQVVR